MTLTKSNQPEDLDTQNETATFLYSSFYDTYLENHFYLSLCPYCILISIMETVKSLLAPILKSNFPSKLKIEPPKIFSHQFSFSLFPAAQNSFNTFLQYSLHIKILKSKNGNGWILLEPSPSLGKNHLSLTEIGNS